MKRWHKVRIDRLVQEFLDGTLSETEWTHQAHLIVCAYHLWKYDEYDATLRIKLGIIKYNEAIGLDNTIDRGYHETMTLFWIWVVRSFIDRYEETDIETIIYELLESPFAKKYLPFFFYSEDCIFSHQARATWIEPDTRRLDSDLIMSEYPQSIWYG